MFECVCVCTNRREPIFAFQWLLIMLVVFTKYLTDPYYNFLLWKMIQKWLLTLTSQGLFTLAHTRCICDSSSSMQLVILSAWLDILLMVVYSLLVMEGLVA